MGKKRPSGKENSKKVKKEHAGSRIQTIPHQKTPEERQGLGEAKGDFPESSGGKQPTHGSCTWKRESEVVDETVNGTNVPGWVWGKKNSGFFRH